MSLMLLQVVLLMASQFFFSTDAHKKQIWEVRMEVTMTYPAESSFHTRIDVPVDTSYKVLFIINE